MTETPSTPGPAPASSTSTAEPPPPPPPPTPPAFWPAFVRPREGRVFRGVCAGLGRATGTDPVLWRVLVVVLAIFGGSGIVLYLAGWLLFPEEGRPPSSMQRFVRGQGATAGAVVAVTALAVLAAFVLLGDGLGLVPVAVVALIAYLVSRGRQQPAAAPGVSVQGPAWAPTPAWAAAPPGGYGPPLGAVGDVPPRFPPAPPPPRSTLGLLTLSAAVLVVGGLLTAGGLGADGITALRVVAAGLLVVGLGLLVGARWGRSRWLIALAAVLALLLAAVNAADGRLDASTGERRWVVTGPAEHALGAGTAVLDLRPLAGTERRDLDVEGRVGFGELVVLVPEDLRVDLTSEVGLGEYTVMEPDGTTRTEDGDRLRRRSAIGPDGARNVRLEVRVGLGDLEVRRVAAGE